MKQQSREGLNLYRDACRPELIKGLRGRVNIWIRQEHGIKQAPILLGTEDPDAINHQFKAATKTEESMRSE